MSFKYNPTTGKLDLVNPAMENALLFKGSISANTDFPLVVDVDNGWFYTILVDVTDNAGASYTNTGQSFTVGDEVAWNGTNWTILGNENDYVPYTGANANVDLGAHNLDTTGVISSGTLTDGTATLTGGALTGVTGGIQLDADNAKLYFGAGDDASLTWDSAKFIIDASAADLAQLADQPTGGTDLAIATTKYVDDNGGGSYTAGTGLELTGTVFSAKTLQDNIMINAFRIAVQGSLSIFNMIDGFVDEYEDETGIDTVTSTGEVYDTSGDYYYPVSGEDLGTDLEARWKLDDDLATRVVIDDISTNNGVLTGNGDTEYISVAGKLGKALDLDGANDHVLAGNIDFTDDKISAFVWVKAENFDDTGNMNIVMSKYETGGNHRVWALRMGTNGAITKTLSLFLGDPANGTLEYNGRANALNIVNTGSWYLVGFTYSTGTLKFYVNGTAYNPTTISGSIPSSIYDCTEEIRLGAFNIGGASANEFDGIIDEARVYSRALTQDQVTALYNGGVGTEDISTDVVENMSLVSEDVTAEAEPNTARIVLLEEDVDAVTINTDLKAYASRDDGSTWDEITLADDGDYDSDKRILTGDVTLTSTGTDMVYKITTANEKSLKIHGVSLTWQ